MNVTKYLSGQHNMQSAIITGNTRHVPFININLSNIPINISINKYQYINIYICSYSSFLPRSENLIHLVTKDEKAAAGNDLIAMSKHMSETLVTTTTKE